MHEIKHTPGPFEVQDPMGSADGFWIVQSGLEAYEWSCIAIVCRDEDRSGKHFITKAEQKANADMFAAAPEMMEALRLVIEEKAPRYHDCTDDGLPKCAWCFAEEAIAKAEGRS